MKPQNLLFSHLFLGSALALTLPNGVHLSLDGDDDSASSNASNKSAIKWAPCELDLGNETLDAMTEKLDCALLTVPLDYTSMSTGETINLQLIRARAKKKPFKGSVLINPGGPGGSGVEHVAAAGPGYRDILGGHFDVIGFDPRGTGRTLPFICDVPDSANSSDFARREFNTLPLSDNWDSLKKDFWEEADALAEACYRDQGQNGRYIGTAFVARDMLSIVDALDQGPKLNYWGTSYGTVLGQVFASKFPDRVGRMLLDSNLLADDYLTTTCISGQRDTERALRNVFNECVDAGPETCPLANFSGPDTTGRDLLTAVHKLFEELIGKPAPHNPKVTGDAVVAEFKGTIIGFLYSPTQFSTVMERVAYALNGDWDKALAQTPEPKSKWSLSSDSNFFGISCGDSSFRVETPDDLYSIYRAHLAQSSFADGIMKQELLCARWRMDAVEKVNANDLRNVKTSFPILFVNGIYDPVTPASNAWEASARFRGSRVLIHEGAGHGLTAHPSNCTNEAVRKYFHEGELPKVGTTCKPNMSGFSCAGKLLVEG
ncbi:hypothetical protein ACKAV7_003617 [Fusarium commune]